jgi:DNA-binding transcriptional LysR family regulator
MGQPFTLDWDNLRFFLEVSRTSRLVTAARRLGVDHTTVSRRIHALENEIGAQLFSRGAAGYTLTETGRRLLPQAEAMENACLTVEQENRRTSSPLSGLVRIGATEGFGTVILAPQMALLTQKHPHLAIDLVAVPRVVNLSRREADIVITLERPARGAYTVTRLTDYSLRLFAAPRYLAAHPAIRSPEDLRVHTFINYIDDLLFSKKLNYLDELCRPERVAMRSTSILAQQEAAVAGAGLAVLPLFMAGRDTRLRPVLHGQVNIIRTFWMSMPTEIKDVARMRATWDFLRKVVEDKRELLLGK